MNENNSICSSKANQVRKTQLQETGTISHEAKEYQKNVIFINPKKFNAVESSSKPNREEVISLNAALNENSLPRDTCNSTKVYINPNFKKPNHLSGVKNNKYKLTNASDEQTHKKPAPFEFKKGLAAELITCKSYSALKKYSLPNGEGYQSKIKPVTPGNVKNNISKNESGQTIFINPNFTSQKSTNCYDTVFQKTSKALSFEDVIKDIKSGTDKHYQSSTVTHSLQKEVHHQGRASIKVGSEPTKKYKIFVNPNKKKIESVLNPDLKVEPKLNDIKKEATQIFMNPSFEKCFCSNTASSFGNPPKCSDKLHYSLSVPTSTNCLTRPAEKTQLIKSGSHDSTRPPKNVLLEGKSSEKTVKRLRTQSSYLYAISATKLVRKRKLSQSVSEYKAVDKPLFVTKTKLVRRCLSRKAINAGNIEKNKLIKNIVLKNKLKNISKNNLQISNSDNIVTLSKEKHNLSNSTMSMSNVLSKSTNITRIRSKNGKSLKVIRVNQVPGETPQPKTIKIINTNERINNHPTRKPLTKNALCEVQNKIHKSQFCKVNVVTKKTYNQTFKRCTKYSLHKCKEKLENQLYNKARYFDKSLKYSALKKLKSFSRKANINRSRYKLVRKNYSRSGVLKGSDKESFSRKPIQMTSRKKLRRTSNAVLEPKRRNFKSREMSIVNIRGVFYQCSRTSLARKKATLKPILQKGKKVPILNIKGQKFKFENNGQILTCLSEEPGRKRIDIGGVTFISSSSGKYLKQTNYHTTRSILLHAKQKSISLLTRRLKKNNEPCLFYHRQGKCSGKEQGTCVRQHDSKYITVCRKFVQGLCADPTCLLSHNISSHNMPTCVHYLAGHCGRDNCMYPHVKVSDSAPICSEFLKGYCPLGDKCAKRHCNICPSFEKGLCNRGKYCLYPHPKMKSNNLVEGRSVDSKESLTQKKEVVSMSNVRYFEDTNLQQETNVNLDEPTPKVENFSTEDQEEELCHLKRRPRLGRLPSYIPLTFDQSFDES